MFGSILVVCIGNICRSVAGERMLRSALPDVTVSSAGLAAVVGAPADPVTAELAAARGVSLADHSARQMTAEIGTSHELILAMSPKYRDEIARLYPQLTGRTMLFDRWTGGRGIEDPHGRPPEVHERVLDEIATGADAWIARLSGGSQ